MANTEPVLVIGAGLAGLSAAVALARAGRSVSVVEAGAAVGGCCSTVLHEGYTFNNGAVYVAVPSLLRAAFARLGMDLDRQVPMAAIAHPHETRLDDGTVVRLSSAQGSQVEGPGAALRTRMLRDGLGSLQQSWGPLYRTLVRDVLPQAPAPLRTLGKLWRYLPRMRGKVDALIAAHFPDAGLQAAVASTLLYTGLPPEQLPATQIIGLLALLEEGFHLPLGGMGAIPAALQRELQRLGVPIRCNARVQRIVAAGGRVRGVVLAGGETLQAGHVVATCSALAVLHQLLPDAARPRRARARARRAPLSHRAIAVQLGCSGVAGPQAFIVNRVPPMPQQGAMHTLRPGTPGWFAYTQPTRVVPELAPAGRAIIELYVPATGVASVSQWTRDMTHRAVGDYLAALRQHLPGMTVETMRVLDPCDFARDRHLYEGALYGLAPGARPDRLFPHRTAVPGLYLAGQTTYPGYGVPTAMYSGIQAAQALMAGA